MLMSSAWTIVRTKPSPEQALLTDVLAPVEFWTITATTVVVKFHYYQAKGFYYILWSKSEWFSSGVHRSKRAIVPEGTQDGAIVTHEVLGFEPESEWFFKLVSNPDMVRGEK